MSADLLTALALFAVVGGLRFGPETWSQALADATHVPWLAALGYAAAWVVVLWLRGLYRLRARWSLRREVSDIVTCAVVLAVATLALLFVVRLVDVSRLFLAVLFPAQAAVTVCSRAVLRRGFERLRMRGGNRRFVLVIGAGPAAQDFADRLEAHPELGLRVIGHLAAPSDEPRLVSRPTLGGLDALEAALHDNVVDEVAICLPFESWSLVEPVTRICEQEGRVVRIPMASLGGLAERGIVEEFDGRHVLSVVPGPDRAVALATKRAVDICLSAVLLVVLSPLLALIALAIRTVDGSPVLFRQQRVGLHGRTFMLLKFRTMTVDAEARWADLAHRNEVDGRAFKLADDPRLTRTGGWLRRTSLDELPQLWNVLRSEMSLVGPRPPLPAEVAGYDIWHRRRLSMKPGITGLWQVEARRDPVFDRWVRIDLDYIDRWSLWLDLMILLRTIPAVIGLQGR